MEDDEKKKRKKDENPYELKEEFPDTINIKPTDEQPEAPAVEAPAAEAPAEGQPEAPAAEAQEVEKTDGQDVDGATGVVSQKTGNAGQTVAQNTTATPTTVNAEDVAGVTMPDFKGIREEMGYNPNAPIVPANNTEPEEPEEPEETDDEVYQRLIEQYGDEEAFPDEYAKYKRNAPPMGTEAGGGAGGTEGGEAGAEGYNPETDPNVQGIRDATATRKQGYDDYLNFIEDFYNKKEEYDRQRQERDSRNAFWRSIGEVGASLVNLLGVSGAFSGRNAYGRGAYSSMQKFDLTTPKLTDKMWADIDKRKEQMDALRLRQAENRLKLNEILAGGQEKEGAAKAQGQKAYDDKAYRDAKAQRDEEHWKAENELRQQIAENNQKNAEAALQETKRHNEQMEKGKSPSGSGGSGGSGGGGKNSIILNYEYVSNAPGAKDGKMTITCPDNVMDKALEVSYREIADCLAQSLGYDNYAAFVATRPSNYKYSGDDQVEKALAWYYRNTLYTQNNDIPKDKETALLDWARGSFGLTQKSGELIQRKVNLYDLSALTANTNENEEEVEELEGNNPYNYQFMWNAQTQEQ